jgi:rare lipoprotein A
MKANRTRRPGSECVRYVGSANRTRHVGAHGLRHAWPGSLAALACATLIAACSSVPPREAAPAPSAAAPTSAPAPSAPVTARRGYYLDDGPADVVPSDLDVVPDAVPRREPLHRFANRPYVVFGREYVPATMLRPYRERGVASWYGRKFHGQKTATGEPYDMFAMTAAHPTLPLPSFARVTNPANGRSVVVRVNDRGPFLHDRVIDLSYAAAHRLGIAQRGSGEVDVEALLPDDTLTAAAPALAPVAVPQAESPELVAPVEAIGSASPAVTTSAGGYVVQLGAFASLPNAREFAARLANQLAALGVEAQVRQVNGLFSVSLVRTAPERKRAGSRIASVPSSALRLPLPRIDEVRRDRSPQSSVQSGPHARWL